MPPVNLSQWGFTPARWLIALLLGLVPSFAAAQDSRIQQLVFDSKRSSVEFEVKLLWLVGVHGRIAVDHFRNSATVDALIDANVVSMRSRGNEEWVKSPEFFDAGHYPEIHFVSESIPLMRLQSGGDIEGVLTLRGISKHVRFEIAEPDCPASSEENCPVEAEGSIRRSDFGMRSRHGTLSDKVDLNFSIYTVSPTGTPGR